MVLDAPVPPLALVTPSSICSLLSSVAPPRHPLCTRQAHLRRRGRTPSSPSKVSATVPRAFVTLLPSSRLGFPHHHARRDRLDVANSPRSLPWPSATSIAGVITHLLRTLGHHLAL
jgi:hypothetical protein